MNTNPVQNYIQDFLLVFASILYEALPFIILGSVIAGILEELLPQGLIARLWLVVALKLKKWLPRRLFVRVLPVVRAVAHRRQLQIGLSGLLGLIFPMCECGIIPVMRRLLGKGLPLSCCVAYILAGPIVNVVVMLSTYVAFAPHEAHMMGGYWMVLFRCGLGYLVALGTASVVERLHRRHGDKLLTPLARPSGHGHLDAGKGVPAEEARDEPGLENGSDSTRRPAWWQRLGNISETALHDFVDITVFLILGALLAALTRQMLTHNDVDELSRSYPVLSIAVMMGLAVLLCLCSEADAFVAASFTTLQPAAKLAFLVLGPMLDLKLYLMYTRVFRPRLIWTIILCVVVQVLLYTLLTHFLWGHFGPSPIPGGTGP